MEAVFDFLSDYYRWTLAFHLMSVIAWMAGIFYLPRLFVYHAEKATGNQALADIYKEMELKLLRVIMNPAMISTWVFGLALVLTPGIVDWTAFWPWIKGGMVLAMTWFHHALAKWRKEFANDANQRTGRFYRLMNEFPTILMFVIVFMVIVKPF